MKIIKQSWETRYEELTIPLSCEDCGAQFVAEGATDDFKVVYTPDPYVKAIVLECPCCGRIILINPSDYPKEVKDVLEFLKKHRDTQT